MGQEAVTTKCWYYLPLSAYGRRKTIWFPTPTLFSISWGGYQTPIWLHVIKWGFDTMRHRLGNKVCHFSVFHLDSPSHSAFPLVTRKDLLSFSNSLNGWWLLRIVATGRGLENCLFPIISKTIFCQIISQKEGHFCNREQDVRGKTELIWRRKS